MYRNQKFNVFISYRGNSEGGLLGSKIYSDLLHHRTQDGEKDFSPFFAPACIPKGEDFKHAISAVLEDIECVILLLNKGFFDNCKEEDDIVYFELTKALSNKKTSFIPVVLDGFSFAELNEVSNLFNVDEVERFRHVNAINYHGIYDFTTETDIIPVLYSVFSEKKTTNSSKDIVEFDLDKFNIANGEKITFGDYPQSVLSDINLVEKIATGIFTGDTILNTRNNRISYGDDEYATIAENPFNKSSFDNGKTINAGSRNYYKIEPLKWITIYENAEYKVLITEKIIDAVPFNLSRVQHRVDNKMYPSNSWEYSYIRRWLNNEFYYDAFTEEERQNIQLVELDNSPCSSYYKNNVNNKTADNVFLISHTEIMQTKYGCGKTTDYAKAKGAYSSTSASHYGHGDWWTRSPGNTGDSVENIDRRGCVEALPFCNFVDDTAASLRVCIMLKK